MDIDLIRQKLRSFAAERDWEQFHNPKNLAMALSCEAAELMEIFQWLTHEESYALKESDEQMARVADEMADVALYLVRFADILGVDLEAAMLRKMDKNAERYPAGNASPRA